MLTIVQCGNMLDDLEKVFFFVAYVKQAGSG